MCSHLIEEVPRAFRSRLEDPTRVFGHVGLEVLARSAVPHHISEASVGHFLDSLAESRVSTLYLLGHKLGSAPLFLPESLIQRSYISRPNSAAAATLALTNGYYNT